MALRSLCCLNRHQKGIYVDDCEKDYRFSSLVDAAKSNISINQFIEIFWCWIDKLSGRMIGAAGDLVNTFDGAVLWNILDYLVKLFVMYAIQNTVWTFMACLLFPRHNQSSSVLSPRIGRWLNYLWGWSCSKNRWLQKNFPIILYKEHSQSFIWSWKIGWRLNSIDLKPINVSSRNWGRTEIMQIVPRFFVHLIC